MHRARRQAFFVQIGSLPAERQAQVLADLRARGFFEERKPQRVEGSLWCGHAETAMEKEPDGTLICSICSSGR